LKKDRILTIYGNGNAFRENVTVGTDKSRNSTQLVQFAVVLRNTLTRLCVNELKVEVVGFGDYTDSGRARIALEIHSLARLRYRAPV
jgi:hypothetical protein